MESMANAIVTVPENSTVTASEISTVSASSDPAVTLQTNTDSKPESESESKTEFEDGASDIFEYECQSKGFEFIVESGSDNHIKWLLITCLMRNIVTRYTAVIFGGAIRDSMRHSYASRKFYSELKTKLKGDLKKQKESNPDYVPRSIQECYDDPTMFPEYSDRFLIPTDIDFFMQESDYVKFKLYMYKRGFYYKEVKKLDLSYINEKCNYGQYKLVKSEIIYLSKNHKAYSIMLDMILCDTLVIPQMDDDFSVNKLLMSRKGIIGSPMCEFDYSEIKEQIDNKIAVCNSTVSEKRYEKMNRKGWTIKMNYSTFVFKLRTNTEEETCIICLDKLKVGELEVLPRVCKCTYSYCKDCIKYSLKSAGCLMCKKEMCMRKKICDIDMYEKHKILN
jgi:hypothetical protein